MTCACEYNGRVVMGLCSAHSQALQAMQTHDLRRLQDAVLAVVAAMRPQESSMNWTTPDQVGRWAVQLQEAAMEKRR